MEKEEARGRSDLFVVVVGGLPSELLLRETRPAGRCQVSGRRPEKVHSCDWPLQKTLASWTVASTWAAGQAMELQGRKTAAVASMDFESFLLAVFSVASAFAG